MRKVLSGIGQRLVIITCRNITISDPIVLITFSMVPIDQKMNLNGSTRQADECTIMRGGNLQDNSRTYRCLTASQRVTYMKEITTRLTVDGFGIASALFV